MHIERLESRRFLSATPVTGVALSPHHDTARSVSVAPQKSQKITINDVVNALSIYGRAQALFVMKVSGNQKLTEAGQFLLDSVSIPQLARAAAAPGPSYTLTMSTTTDSTSFPFDPSFIDPFPATYTFSLNTKKPLNLFNITQKIGKKTLKFTGVMSSNLQKITGVLNLNGPNQHANRTYTLTPETV